MREIKFRAWDGEQMYYAQFCEYLSGYACSFPYITTPKNIMQYTGLKDKNGKEIYHGDLLKFENPDGEAFYKGKAIVIKTESLGYDFQPVPSLTNEDMLINSYDSSMFWHDFDTEVEVIGNIYENPELLK